MRGILGFWDVGHGDDMEIGEPMGWVRGRGLRSESVMVLRLLLSPAYIHTYMSLDETRLCRSPGGWYTRCPSHARADGW